MTNLTRPALLGLATVATTFATVRAYRLVARIHRQAQQNRSFVSYYQDAPNPVRLNALTTAPIPAPTALIEPLHYHHGDYLLPRPA